MNLKTGAAFVGMVIGAPAASIAQVPSTNDIVITAYRSGAPTWYVKNGAATLILVGSIEAVTANTRWNADPLIQALKEADRVSFPAIQDYQVSPFRLVGYMLKWRHFSRLPKGQSLRSFISPEDMARLERLRQRNLVKPDYETKHPYEVSLELSDSLFRDVKYGKTAEEMVRAAGKKIKFNMEPVPKADGREHAEALFDSPPTAHVQCLRDMIAIGEADPTIVEARSQAWSQRRVKDVLASPVDRLFSDCWPNSVQTPVKARLSGTLRADLKTAGTTVAVVELSTLAKPGGILDQLKAAGFEMHGPAWH